MSNINEEHKHILTTKVVDIAITVALTLLKVVLNWHSHKKNKKKKK